MEIDSILKIIDAVSQSNAMSFEMEDKDFRLFIDKNVDNRIGSEVHITNPNGVQMSPMPIQVPISPMPLMGQEGIATAQQSVVEKAVVSEVKAEVSGNIVKSPIVGTFYSSAGADSADYVKVGDKVKKGQVLCIIEAMKLMNEIESEFDGEIAEILVQNEQMVEFGQALYKII